MLGLLPVLLQLCASLSASAMHARFLTQVDPEAACNDGSPGVYYIDNLGVPASRRWVIRFMGGGWCTGAESCRSRWDGQRYLMSSAQLPREIQAGQHVPGVPDVVLPLHGLMSADVDENPLFAGWRRVYIWYCSSDSHLGEAPAGHTTETGAWRFMGKRIMRAAVADMCANEGLCDAETVLVTGDSAGGVGAMNNAAEIHDYLRPRAKHLKTLKVLVDAGWFVDIPSFSSASSFSFRRAAKTLQGNYNATFDRHCGDVFGPAESWRCFHAQYAWPHIEPPALYLEYLYDKANLEYDAAQPGDYESFRKQLLASFRLYDAAGSLQQKPRRAQAPSAGRRLLDQPAPTGSPPPPPLLGVFAPACRMHESIDSAGFRGLRLGQQRLQPLLEAWLQRGAAVSLIDTHAGVRADEECLNATLAVNFGSSGR